MQMKEINDYARRLREALGDKAIAKAAQKADACQRRADARKATTWRRIEAKLRQMQGPHAS